VAETMTQSTSVRRKHRDHSAWANAECPSCKAGVGQRCFEAPGRLRARGRYCRERIVLLESLFALEDLGGGRPLPF
jgi:hypothetical protein